MRVLISGPRSWKDPIVIKKRLALLPPDVTIVVGYDPKRRYPPGVDKMTYGIAKAWKMDVEPHPADWDGLGKRAGILRNYEMLDYPVPHLVIAFWDGKSTGTGHVITTARMRSIPLEIIYATKQTAKKKD